MSNPFATPAMAAGYARARPPVHRALLERCFARLGRRFVQAVDVGCGSGVSTRALADFATRRAGFEPAAGMLAYAGAVAPGAVFFAAAAEAIPLRDACADLMTAAGSLNYVAGLDAFFGEAARVLSRDGVLLVYDFSAGRRFRDSSALDRWFAEFCARYPPPLSDSRPLDPEILRTASPLFALEDAEVCEISLPLGFDFYVAYMLTETNVALAARDGADLGAIREWCEQTLRPVWSDADEREVVFRGYWAALRPVD